MAAVISAVASLLTAIALLFSVITNRKNIKQVQNNIDTVNGIPIGGLMERQEGRRIQKIPEHSRTDSEQIYVDNLIEGGRDL